MRAALAAITVVPVEAGDLNIHSIKMSIVHTFVNASSRIWGGHSSIGIQRDRGSHAVMMLIALL